MARALFCRATGPAGPAPRRQIAKLVIGLSGNDRQDGLVGYDDRLTRGRSRVRSPVLIRAYSIFFCSGGLVVEYLVANEVARVRFPAGAHMLVKHDWTVGRAV